MLADKWLKKSGLSIKHSVTLCKHFFIASQDDLDMPIHD
jgi:hypothetical protein